MTPSNHRLEALAAAYASGGVEQLKLEFGAVPLDDALVQTLVEGHADPRSAVAASWCLRAALELGVELDRSTTAGLCRLVSKLEADDARLHICQLIRHLDVPIRNAEQLARFLRSGAAGDHKLVRAWAIDGLQHLARQHDRYRLEALEWLERARLDPAASVRARARRIDAER